MHASPEKHQLEAFTSSLQTVAQELATSVNAAREHLYT